ncbi:hypothetical protein CYMTET_11641 [Cymbomonas tetramitiformis]|uniref:Uncharacterized protein n=1 Tax=Cymbomonas tetramitiformis TaxID=36881 RepID=A0AAE0LCT9_9CHLO|nr:hypothetical protein CYMTET_11641 [Cymbomonas tetramitiformis]
MALALVAGGAISARQTTLILRESQLNTNRVTSSGGAMHIKDSEVSVAQSTFKFNQAQAWCGAPFVDRGPGALRH